MSGATNERAGETGAKRPRAASGVLSATLGLLFRAPAVVYRLGGGFLFGHRFMLLVHRGRRSGRKHETVLEVVAFDPRTQESIVVSAFGPEADWLRNIEAAEAIAVVIGRGRYRPAHRRLDRDEAVEVLSAYEARNRLIAPIVRKVLSWLLGWQYDSSLESRRRLAGELPFVGFRPVA